MRTKDAASPGFASPQAVVWVTREPPPFISLYTNLLVVCGAKKSRLGLLERKELHPSVLPGGGGVLASWGLIWGRQVFSPVSPSIGACSLCRRLSLAVESRVESDFIWRTERPGSNDNGKGSLGS